jgi:hypothetical protein
MKNTASTWAAGRIAILAAGLGFGSVTASLADERPAPPRPPPVHFSGLINDYTPASVKNGPYEMHGKWSLDLPARGDTARFSASMDMETTDAGKIDQNDPTTRGAHTHHISMTDGVVTSDWNTSCPTFSPAVTGGFVVSGHAQVTGNGGPPPFGNPSALTICVLGVGSAAAGAAHVTYSNVTLTFTTPASGHFGPQAIHGVVTRCAGPWLFESDECTLDQ